MWFCHYVMWFRHNVISWNILHVRMPYMHPGIYVHLVLCTLIEKDHSCASAQVVETSVTNNSPSQDSYHPDDLFQSRYATPGFKPFSYLRSLGRQSEKLANDYISYARNVRRIKQQLWFNHRCKDLGLVPAGLRIKSPLNTKEAICIVKATCRRLIRARINDCRS